MALGNVKLSGYNVPNLTGGIKMNKAQLIEAIAKESDLHLKQAETCLNAFMTSITNALTSGDKVQLVGFGAFEVANRAARDGRNPKPGELIKTPAAKVPKFSAGKVLKDALN